MACKKGLSYEPYTAARLRFEYLSLSSDRYRYTALHDCFANYGRSWSRPKIKARPPSSFVPLAQRETEIDSPTSCPVHEPQEDSCMSAARRKSCHYTSIPLGLCPHAHTHLYTHLNGHTDSIHITQPLSGTFTLVDYSLVFSLSDPAASIPALHKGVRRRRRSIIIKSRSRHGQGQRKRRANTEICVKVARETGTRAFFKIGQLRIGRLVNRPQPEQPL